MLLTSSEKDFFSLIENEVSEWTTNDGGLTNSATDVIFHLHKMSHDISEGWTSWGEVMDNLRESSNLDFSLGFILNEMEDWESIGQSYASTA